MRLALNLAGESRSKICTESSPVFAGIRLKPMPHVQLGAACSGSLQVNLGIVLLSFINVVRRLETDGARAYSAQQNALPNAQIGLPNQTPYH